MDQKDKIFTSLLKNDCKEVSIKKLEEEIWEKIKEFLVNINLMENKKD